MAKSFKDALADAMARTAHSVQTVAAGAGIDPDDLHRVLTGASGSLDLQDANRVAGFFSVTLADFLEARELTDPIEIAELYSQLPEHLKAQFRVYQPGQTASLDLPDPELP